MGREDDWAALWHQLASRPHWQHPEVDSAGRRQDPWARRARDFDENVRKKWTGPDPIRDFVGSQVDHDTTVLDIGAGTGRWAIFLARRVRQVTAMDPSPAMLKVLRENLATEGVDNVDVVQGAWPDAEVGAHDVTLCSHAMYSSPDLPRFVRRMIEVTRRTCYLLIRVPAHQGVMREVAQRLWGQPHDSANFVIGYNVLLEMGIYANVLVDPGFRPWTSPDLDSALKDLKGRFGLAETTEHDDYLRQLLQDRLTWRDNEYVWPDGMRSALVYWNVDS